MHMTEHDNRGTAPEDYPAETSTDPELTQRTKDYNSARIFADAHGGSEQLGVPSLTWGAGQLRRIHLIESHIGLKNRRILDVGCGIGAYVQHLRTMSEKTYGIDIEWDRVSQGATEVPGLVVASGDALPFGESSFDVIIFNEVLEHVTDQQQTLLEAARVLTVGGHIVIFVPNRGFPFETHGIYWRGTYHFGNYPFVNYLPMTWRNKLVPHARVYSSMDIKLLLKGLPFKPIEKTIIYPGFDGIRARHDRLGWLLQNLLHRSEQTPLRMFGLSHFIILERTEKQT